MTVHIALFDIVVHIDADSMPVTESSTPTAHALRVPITTPVVKGIQKDSDHTRGTPGSALKVSFDTSNNKRSIRDSTPSTVPSTSTASKRGSAVSTRQPLAKEPNTKQPTQTATVVNCKWDKRGCINGSCTFLHEVSYKLQCKDVSVRLRYSCLSTDCKFLHGTSTTPPASPDNRNSEEQTQPSKRQRTR